MNEFENELGFIKLNRKILEWEWYSDNNTKSLFLHCILKANYKDKRWRGIIIKRGTFVTSLRQLSIELGLSIQSIRTSLKKLKSTHELTHKSTSANTVITVVNYDLYQSTNTQTTNEQQTSNKRVTTTKKEKNIKKERINKKNPSKKNLKGDDFKIIYPFNSENFLKMWNLWKVYKQKEFKFTYKSSVSEQGALKKLTNLGAGDELTCIAIIEQSISNGWKGFFKLKNENKINNNYGKSTNKTGAKPETIARIFAEKFGH